MIVAGVVAAVVVVVAAGLAVAMERRTSDPPTQPELEAPAQVDRADFPAPESSWLVVLFTSSTCDACVAMRPKVSALASDAVAVVDVDWSNEPALHERYRVPGVPLTLIVDHEGIVRRSFFSAVTATDLWAAIAEAREPGSTPVHGDEVCGS